MEWGHPFGVEQIERKDLSPKEIYAELRKATVLIVALQPSKTADKPQPNLQSSQKGGVNLRPFIESFIAAGESQSDYLAELPFYADRVEYFDNGVVSRDFIIRDIQKYVTRWPKRRYWIEGDIRTAIVDQQQDITEVRFRLNFAVQNSMKAARGICDDVLLIRGPSSNPKIIAIKAKTISRNEEPIRR